MPQKKSRPCWSALPLYISTEKKMKKSYISEKILGREEQISLDGGGQLCYNSTLRETVSRILLCREEGAPC